ncbi:hypothetical protein K435DRAFT_739358 [Dendrothele bispora CBS 962.96]|uniref:CHAT domain-containing protein n=1 Tax=Dendrothele bispora (strain CBS 962.96) TaxID=1314807 RepID=A0A4S8KLG1_DENBC|nr:hypothetical protein K435DRAFT_739358 [Dendrothele bispora CBS 962.96]
MRPEPEEELPRGYHCREPETFTFTPFPDLNIHDLRRKDDQYGADSVVCYTEKAQWKFSAELDVSPPTGVLLPVGAGAGGGHQSSHSEGAALILKNGAIGRDCLPIDAFPQWISENAERLYYLARNYHVPNGGLYLVTGFTKTNWWQISAFSKDSGSKFASFEFDVLSALGVKFSGQRSRERAMESTPRRSLPDSPDKNQTVFLRGWKFMLRPKGWSSLNFKRLHWQIHTEDMDSADELNKVGPPLSFATSNHQERSGDGGNGPGKSEDGEDRGGGRGGEAGGSTGGSSSGESREGNQGGGGSGNGGQGHGGTSNRNEGNGNYQSQQRGTEPNEAPVRSTSQDSDEDSDESVESVELDDYPKLLPYHPSDIINKYLLECEENSQIAMTHDSTWIGVLDDDDDSMPNEEELIVRIKERYKIEKSDDGKCVFFMPVVDNKSLTGTKKTSSLEVERASNNSTPVDDEDTKLEKINILLDQAQAETTSNTLLNAAEQAKLKQALVLSTLSLDDEAAQLNNLGLAFQSRFERFGKLRDMENAILIEQWAVDLTPDGHASKARWLSHLGDAFICRFEHLGKPRDIIEAIVAYKQATENTSSPSFTRYDAACRWAILCSKHQSPSLALDAYTVVLEIIPQIVWLGQTVHRQYEELFKIGRTINAAAAMAISVGDLPRAVEWLEEGWSIVWTQILQLRTPLDELHQQHPDFADELSRVSLALDNAGTSSFQSNSSEIKHKSVEEEAQKHCKLAARYEELLQQVRELDGFSSFLRPKKISELAPAARNGPVAVVNVAELRCDALVLCTSGEIIPVPLPTFSYKQAETLHSKLLSLLQGHHVRGNQNKDRASRTLVKGNQNYFKLVLADLWSHVVQPILSQLEQALYKNDHHSLPHITWCATGVLAFLPLHAAGIYGSGDPTKNMNISDFVVSSYTTTLTAMLGFGSKPKQGPTKTPSVLIISQPSTPGLTSLPGTVEEVEAIQRYTSPDHICHLTHEQATVEAVLDEMSKHEIIHLACHGIQNVKNPLSSAFALYDGRLELTTLLMLSLKNAELAFLSACQTAIGDGNLPEETVHLAAGMLAVGYPSVIATMWSIGDKDATLIADKVYANLLGHHDDTESQQVKLTPAYALHEAVKHLREEVGEMNFVRWVPFIHLGV